MMLSIAKGDLAQSCYVYFARRQDILHKVLISGVGGEVCVQQAALGINEIVKSNLDVAIEESLVDYLSSADRANMLQARNTAGVITLIDQSLTIKNSLPILQK